MNASSADGSSLSRLDPQRDAKRGAGGKADAAGLVKALYAEATRRDDDASAYASPVEWARSKVLRELAQAADLARTLGDENPGATVLAAAEKWRELAEKEVLPDLGEAEIGRCLGAHDAQAIAAMFIDPDLGPRS